MKKILVLSALLVNTVMTSCAQDISSQQVPSVVMNAFSTTYPKATDIEWEQNVNVYKVDFDLSFQDHELLIDSTGKVIRHKQDINASELPAPVKDTIAKRYKGYRIDDADKIEQEGKVYYKVELEQKENELKLVFNPDGSVSNIIF